MQFIQLNKLGLVFGGRPSNANKLKYDLTWNRVPLTWNGQLIRWSNNTWDDSKIWNDLNNWIE